MGIPILKHSLGTSTTMGKRSRSLDLLHPIPDEEKRKHKLKRLVQSPNSFFMDVKCPGCFHITTVQACTNCCLLQCMCHCSVPTYWWQVPPYRGLLLPQKGRRWTIDVVNKST